MSLSEIKRRVILSIRLAQRCSRDYMKKHFQEFKARLYQILFVEHSTTTRLLFGVATFFFGIFFLTSTVDENLHYEYKFMAFLAPLWLWGIGFLVNGAALTVGAYTNKYSKIQLFLEGVLGVVVWVGSAYAVTVAQRTIGAHTIAGLIAFWIYIRYPTHWVGDGIE